MNWILIALMISTAQAGEFAKKVKDVPEENLFWTQRKAAKKMAGMAAMVQGSEFEIKPAAIKKLIKAKKEHVNIFVLLSGVKEKLLLVKQEPFTYETDSVHYAGIVKGDDQSVVSLSIFDGKLTGSISTKGKRYTLNTEGVQTSVLDTSEIKAPETKDTVLENTVPQVKADTAEFPSNETRPVKVFLEADYKAYLAYGSNEAALRQYLQSVWASVAALYANDGITVQNSGIKIWTTQDPYSTLTETNSQLILNNYKLMAPLVTGSHLMHLITIRPGMGGIAYLSALCGSINHGLSSIYSTFSSGSVAYDWTQNVVTHEIGHNLSSPHTQNCSWTVDGKADQVLDGCFAPESSTCSRPWTTPPVGFKGTIMSYCHLSGNMDLRAGFGPQPRDKIKNYIAQASCLGSPSPDTQAPVVSITSPTLNQTLVGQGPRRTVSFTAFADDDVAVTKVDFILKGPAGNLANMTMTDTSYPFAVALNVRDWIGSTSLVGNYSIQAKAYDASGKTTSTAVIPFKLDYAPIDSVAPVVTALKPAANFNWTSGTMEVAFTATDNVGVTSVSAYGNNQSLGGFSGSSFSRVLDYTWFVKGPMKIDMYAFDADGNFGKSTVNITLGTGDITKPTISILNPTYGQVVSGVVPFTFNAQDNVGVTKVIANATPASGGALVKIGESITAPFNISVDTRTLTNGDYLLTAQAFDAAGNVGQNTTYGWMSVNNVVVPPSSFNINSFVVGQDKTVADSTKRNWIDLTLTGVVGTPTFQGKALANSSWSTKAGADAVKQANGDWRIFFFNANTDYQVKAMCKSCSPYAEKIQAFKSLP